MITSQPPFSPDRVSEKVATVPPPLPPPLLLPKRLDLPQEEEDYIPDDPVLAETHYSQFNDFESDENNDSGQEENSDDDDDDDGDDDEDEMEDLLVCIEDALELSKKPGESGNSSSVVRNTIDLPTPTNDIMRGKVRCVVHYGDLRKYAPSPRAYYAPWGTLYMASLSDLTLLKLILPAPPPPLPCLTTKGRAAITQGGLP